MSGPSAASLFGFALALVCSGPSSALDAALRTRRSTITAAPILGTIGFLIGIGCFDYWWRWIARPPRRREDHSMHGASQLARLLQGQHRPQGHRVQYLVIVFFFFVVGGLLAEAGPRRAGRSPASSSSTARASTGLFSVHATLMIFLFVIPAFAGLANFVLPIMIGAKDMAFPRLNALSVWMLLPGGS